MLKQLETALQSDTNKEKLKLLSKVVLAFVILAIVFLRLKSFIHANSLMIDEANIARNIAERGFAGFWQTLDYEQYAPPLFMSLVKLSTLIFGLNEYSLRLPTILVSLFNIYLIVKLCRQRSIDLNNWYISIVLVLYGCSYLMLDRSNMVKQYMFDAMFALVFALWTLNTNYKQFFRLKNIVLWSLFGLFSIWFSMPVVFVLAAVGVYFFYQSIEGKEWHIFLLHFSIPVIIWVANFLIYFFLLLKSDAESSYLQDYHGKYFLSYEFWTLDTWIQNWKIIEGLIQAYVGASAVAVVWFLLLFVVGKMYLAKKHHELFILLLLPFAFAAVASLLYYYSFIPRLLLFTMSFIFIVMVIGLRDLVGRKYLYVKWVLILITVFVLSKMNAWVYILPGQYCRMEDTREVLEEFKLDKDYMVFVNNDGAPALIFYTNYYDKKDQFSSFLTYRRMGWDESLVTESEEYLSENPESNLVLIWGHSTNEQIENEVNQLKAKGFVFNQDIKKWRARAVELQYN